MRSPDWTDPSPPNTGYRWIPWLIAAGFGIVVLVNGIMVYFAMESFSGLTADNYYQRGLHYNDVISAEQKQEKLHWGVEMAFKQTGDKHGRLSLHAVDGNGIPLNGAVVTVRLERPVQAGHDMYVTLAAAGDGLYAADVDLPFRGQWEILAQIKHPSGMFSTAKRIVAQ